MRRHLSYLKYVLRHKWFVFVAGRKIKCGIFRMLLHDISKFRPREWSPYAFTFYNKDGFGRYNETIDFNYAWNSHQKTNKHHWQYWVLQEDSGKTICLPIPKKYILEMIADWMGAGKAITGEWEVCNWYEKNKNKIQLNPHTKDIVEELLNTVKETK